MTARTRLRAAITTTVSATALAFVASVAASTPAMADDLCYGGGVTGSITGSHGVPVFCVQTVLPSVCTTPTTSVGTLIGVWAEACVPD
ncbi:MAG: hypothetical protein JWO88_2980 [Frankiales bacterium]|nr:hypothetical protein [Frankiales bacterium]